MVPRNFDAPVSRRQALAAAGSLASLGLSGCLGGADTASDGDDGTGDSGDPNTQTNAGDAAWRTQSLTDVLSGESFTVSQFEGRPVLLETFAVWCPTCTKQQKAFASLLDRRDEIVAVSLNVDPNEDADKVREHAESKGFDWRYVISPPEVTKSLADQFGTVITNPPSAPVVRICPGGAAALVDGSGAKSPDELAAAFDGC